MQKLKSLINFYGLTISIFTIIMLVFNVNTFCNSKPKKQNYYSDSISIHTDSIMLSLEKKDKKILKKFVQKLLKSYENGVILGDISIVCSNSVFFNSSIFISDYINSQLILQPNNISINIILDYLNCDLTKPKTHTNFITVKINNYKIIK